MKNVLCLAAAVSLLGFVIGCNGGTKAPTGKPVATTLKPSGPSDAAPPTGANPFKGK